MKPKTYLLIMSVLPLLAIISGVILAIFLVIHLSSSETINYLSMIGKDENQLELLEQGKITNGVVTRAYYEKGAPAGWRVYYDIQVTDPSTGNIRTYWGWSLGPKKYYAHLSSGDNIKVIYDPCDPRVNSEIKRFLNEPSFRHTFEKAGKLRLLDKFKDRYKLEDYNLRRWHYETIEK